MFLCVFSGAPITGRLSDMLIGGSRIGSGDTSQRRRENTISPLQSVVARFIQIANVNVTFWGWKQRVYCGMVSLTSAVVIGVEQGER